MQCPKCKKHIPDISRHCSNCGVFIPPSTTKDRLQPTTKDRLQRWVMIALVTFLVLLAFFIGRWWNNRQTVLVATNTPTAIVPDSTPTPIVIIADSTPTPTVLPTFIIPDSTPAPTNEPTVVPEPTPAPYWSHVYVEYILDASGSMMEEIDGELKIDMAKDLLATKAQEYPYATNVGLRVYGHRFDYENNIEASCGDIELLVPPRAGGRDLVLEYLPALTAKGMTPLSQSVIKSVEDFDHSDPSRHNSLVVISDGQETCDRDPCSMADDLINVHNISFTMYVIGFDILDNPTAQAQLKCLADKTGGVFLQANNRNELAQALDSIWDTMDQRVAADYEEQQPVAMLDATATSELTPAAGFTPESVCRVPDLVELDLSEAESTLAAAGLQPVKDFRHDDSVAQNAIIWQEPVAGTRLEPCQGDVVIVVSLGPVPIPTDTPRPTDVPASPTPMPTETSLPPTLTPYPGLIPFASPNDPNALNPILGWLPGSSTANAYDLTRHPGALTMIASAGVDQWKGADSAPLIIYPFTGNFEAQVKVVFNPNRNWQGAGLGVRSAQDNRTWLRIIKAFDNQSLVRFEENISGNHVFRDQRQYSNRIIFLKIFKINNFITASYSENGKSWVDIQFDYIHEIEEHGQIYLVTLSNSNQDISAQFSDFVVLDR